MGGYDIKVLVTLASSASTPRRRCSLAATTLSASTCANNCYDPRLKKARLAELNVLARGAARAAFMHANLADKDAVFACFKEHRFDRVIHLAAQAGVEDYVEAKIVAFTNILEACRHNGVPHLTYASTSSVYGANTRTPFSDHCGVDHPLQFYAATEARQRADGAQLRPSVPPAEDGTALLSVRLGGRPVSMPVFVEYVKLPHFG
jgi:NAD dependent epimerase/dehydratase family